MNATDIPNKLYFRIGEVSDIVGVKPYVLRYWESEFADIKPSKSKSGQRLYKRRDVEMLLRIKELLYEERFTINGARKRLRDFGRSDVRAEQGEHGTEISDEAHEVKPRQLDVFEVATHEQGDVFPEKILASSAPAIHHTQPQRDSSKTLVKIRRDLQELLEMIRL